MREVSCQCFMLRVYSAKSEEYTSKGNEALKRMKEMEANKIYFETKYIS
jgi:hypothetical protein